MEWMNKWITSIYLGTKDKSLKIYLKEWDKTYYTPSKKRYKEKKEKLNQIHENIEKEQVMIELLKEEKEAFHKYQNSLRTEEEIWSLKSQCLWTYRWR
jgi:hypothetical protein